MIFLIPNDSLLQCENIERGIGVLFLLPVPLAMGFDANIKYSKAEQRFRTVFFIALTTLALSFVVIISLIEQPVQLAVNSTIKQNNVGSSHDVKKSQPVHTTALHIDEATVSQRLANLDEAVRALKQTDIIMETDEEALKLTKLLQQSTRELIQLRYGEIDKDKRYRVRLDLEFQSTIPGEFDGMVALILNRTMHISHMIACWKILKKKEKTEVC